MLQHVNTVLVGGAQGATITPTTIDGMSAGSIVLADKDGKLIKTAALAAAADKVRIGLVTGDSIAYTTPAGANATVKKVEYSNWITRESVKNYLPFSYTAAKEDKIVFTFTNTPVVAGNRYVLRIIYRDLYEHPGQFTHTYELIATGTDLKANLIDEMVKLINKDPRRRVTATGAATTITLDALAKTDNEGKESINIYTQVNMEAVMYYTNPSATGFASKNKYPLAGLAAVKTPGTPGEGNPKLIRDREQAALSYKGITNRTWFPVIKPELRVDLSKSYDGFVLEFTPSHANAEDSFSRTKQAVEVYVDNSTAYSASLLYKLMQSFVTGVAVA